MTLTEPRTHLSETGNPPTAQNRVRQLGGSVSPHVPATFIPGVRETSAQLFPVGTSGGGKTSPAFSDEFIPDDLAYLRQGDVTPDARFSDAGISR